MKWQEHIAHTHFQMIEYLHPIFQSLSPTPCDIYTNLYFSQHTVTAGVSPQITQQASAD